MDCKQVNYYLEDYLDGLLDESTRESLQRHVQDCPECQNRINREQEFRETLRSIPVAAPSPDFKQRAFKRVYTSRSRQNFYSSRLMKAAAGILVLVCLGIIFNSVWNLGQQEIPQAYLTMNKQSEVKLVFSSQQDLENVTLTLKTPEGVDIPGYEDQRKIAWQTDLRQGKNVLELPVIARDRNGGSLTASIDYGDKSKEFNLLLKVGQEAEDANTGSLEKEKMRQYKLS